jgi:PAS domain S-box-containing protein
VLKSAPVDLTNESQRTLLNALPIPVMIADADGVVAFLNDRWHAYTGQPKAPDAGFVWNDYLHPGDRDRVAGEWLGAIAAELDSVEMECRLKEAATDVYRWFRVRATALKDESGVSVQWIAAAMDIEEERQQQLVIARLYEDSLAVARTLQSAMLPPALPQGDGLDFEAFYLPSERSLSVAGDWYDAFTLPDGSVAIAIGDVTGHGIEAAVLMAKARYSMRAIMRRTAALRTGNVASVLRSVEDALASEHPEARATAFLGIISPDRTRLRYANAGHPPPLVLDASGRLTWLEGSDIPLGWRFVLERRDRVLDLLGVSRLLLYTDGLIEAGRDIIAGMERLGRIARMHSRNEDSFLESVIKETLVHAPHDDVAALGVRFV